MKDWYDGTLALSTDHVLSDETFYMQLVAGLYFQKKFFWVKDQEDYTDLLSTLLKEDIRRYAFMQSTHSEITPLVKMPLFHVVKIGESVYEIVE